MTLSHREARAIEAIASEMRRFEAEVGQTPHTMYVPTDVYLALSDRPTKHYDVDNPNPERARQLFALGLHIVYLPAITRCMGSVSGWHHFDPIRAGRGPGVVS